MLLLCLAAAALLSAQTPRLGTIDFPTSGAPAAQTQFIRGVLLLHSFEYQDAARAFREAQRLDSALALAYWGEALSYTHPLWNEQDLNAARAALQRLGPTAAARRAQAPTLREQAYLDAVEILYGEGSKAERDTAYSTAMGRLVKRFPADREAKVFYALSLLGLNQGVRDVPTYLRAAAIVEPVFRENPNHPGAAHLLIHCYDDPSHAVLGLRAARAYSKIAPDAAHAQHMTTHIFLALGMWDEVVSQNEIASGHDHAAWTPHHYTEWLGYGYLQQGRYREALQHLELMYRNVNQARRGRPVLAEMRAAYVVNTERWDSPCLQWRIALMREATALEDAMPVEYGPPPDVKPAHELFGEMLLQAGRPQEAQQEFARALALAPKRALSLLGLGRAAAAAGDRATATRAYSELREIWHGADPSLPGLADATRFLAANP